MFLLFICVSIYPFNIHEYNVMSFNRNDSFHSKSPDQGSLSTGGTLSLVKSGSQKMKTTPAGEYLTAALMDFNPDQYESLATVADGANKLLMLVGN